MRNLEWGSVFCIFVLKLHLQLLIFSCTKCREIVGSVILTEVTDVVGVANLKFVSKRVAFFVIFCRKTYLTV